MKKVLGVICALAFFLQGARAATVVYNWAITWVEASPDGFKRPVIGLSSLLTAACTNCIIGVNHQWPCPTISVNLGDQIVVNVVNELGNETIGIHFHGQYQTGTATMDGPQGVNQCPILPGESFTYNFTVSRQIVEGERLMLTVPGESCWFLLVSQP
jgi:iron transport multicopper oxidase